MATSSFRNISVATALLIAIYGHTGMVAEASDLDEVIEQPANDAGPASSAAVGNDMWFGMVTDVDSQASTFRLNESVFEWKSLAPWSLRPEVGQSFLIAGRFESTNRTYQAFALYDPPEENIIPNGKIPQARLSSLGGGSLLVAEPFRQSALHGGNTAGIHGGNVAGIHGGNTAGIHGGNVAGIHGGNTAGIHGGNVAGIHGGNIAGIHGGNVAGIHGGNTAGIHGGNVAGIHGGNTAGIHGGNYH